LFYRTGPLLACLNAAKTVSQTATQFSNETPGTISLAVTPDGKHALIANEYGLTTSITSQGQSFSTSGSIGVVGLHAAFTQPAPVFAQLLVGGNALAGLLLSKSGRTLYVTSEVSWPTTAAAGSANPFLASGTCVQAAGAPPQANGLLTVIDVAQLEIDAAAAVAATPAANTPFTPVFVDQAIRKTISVPFSTLFATTAIRATIDAGCSPVRMAETGNARPTLWVTARGDNRVLAFDTALLESETSADTQGRALIGAASSGGTAPVGLALFGGGQYLAVANSNRFQPNAPGNVALLKLTADAQGNYAATVVETLDTDGMFPREINVGADDATLYVTNFLSRDFLVIPTKLK
jgi:DNA-binding beta-propeller fold protein YncE